MRRRGHLMCRFPMGVLFRAVLMTMWRKTSTYAHFPISLEEISFWNSLYPFPVEYFIILISIGQEIAGNNLLNYYTSHKKDNVLSSTLPAVHSLQDNLAGDSKCLKFLIFFLCPCLITAGPRWGWGGWYCLFNWIKQIRVQKSWSMHR